MDAIVLGGGVVGLVMANILAQTPDFKICLVTNNLPQLTWESDSYDLRCSAISRAAQLVLQHVGVWEEIVAQPVGIYDQMYVWDKGTNANLHFIAKELGEAQLGYIIENRNLQRALYNKLLTASNVEIVVGEPTAMQSGADKVTLQMPGCTLNANLIIGADGADSWLRAEAKIAVNKNDYQHTAIVATIATELPHNNTAWQRFAADGPLAFLPLHAANLCSIVWSTDPAHAKQLMAMPANQFSECLAEEFSYKLGAVQLHGARAAFPLRMLHSQTYIAQRLALIGDAAHVIHPMAGQGLNLGILDAAILGDQIKLATEAGLDIGSRKCLRKFELRRRGQVMTWLALVGGLKRMFGAQHTLVQGLRSYGLNLLNSLNIIKQPMLQFALGLNRDLPDYYMG